METQAGKQTEIQSLGSGITQVQNHSGILQSYTIACSCIFLSASNNNHHREMGTKVLLHQKPVDAAALSPLYLVGFLGLSGNAAEDSWALPGAAGST
jgi:hypothetical protein